MSVWARDIESERRCMDPHAQCSSAGAEVVENAKHTFEQFASVSPRPNPALPPPPVARSRRTSQIRSPSSQRRASRVPRKVLAANRIFSEEASPNRLGDTLGRAGELSGDVSGDVSGSVGCSPSATRTSVPKIAVTGSPARPRRNTVGTESPAKGVSGLRSPEPQLSPSKRRKSSSNLRSRHITPIAQLNLQLEDRKHFRCMAASLCSRCI
jgi:serine/threonine-protein kinase GIN4